MAGKSKKGEVCSTSKVSPCALGGGIGAAWGLLVMLVSYATIWSGARTTGVTLLNMLDNIYPGYQATYVGGLYGLFWGFLTGFVFGVVIAVVYNFWKCKCPCGWCNK